MKKMLAMMILMSLLSVSCNDSGESSSHETSLTTDTGNLNPDTGIPDDDDSDSDSDSDSDNIPSPEPDIPALALSWDTNVELFDFTASQEEKYNKAVSLVKKVVATEKFKNLVLNHTWNGAKKFSSTTHSNAQVYQAVLDAAEKLTPSKNNTMDVGVKLYYENNSVVGWTNGSITYFNVNTKFFNQYDIHQVAGNLFHEWLHKLGYGHDSAATAQRPYSVPYAVGYIIRDIGKSFL